MTDIEVVEGHTVEEVEEVSNLPAVRAHEAMVVRAEIDVDELLAQRDKVVQAMERAMVSGVHYGRIPGIDKPTLLKPGAELLNVLFRLSPSYHSERTWHDDGHLTVVTNCTLTHIPSGLVIAEGEGLCSTREGKYAYRTGGRVCPECGKDAIIKSKAEYGGGWLCFKKKGGCGTKYADGTDQANTFEATEVGRVPNEDLPDTYNTVLKIAAKRALIAAILNGTAASDVFTQDVEDAGTPAGGAEKPADAQKPSTPTRQSPKAEKPSQPQKVEGAIAPAAVDFDPGTDLLEGAIRGKDYSRRLAKALEGIGSSADIDWHATIMQAWPGERTAEFWRRLANMVEYMTQQHPHEMPPVSDEELQAAFAWAFQGATVEIIHPQAQAEDETAVLDSVVEPDEQIPFGDET